MARLLTNFGTRNGCEEDGPGPWTPVRLALAKRCTPESDAILLSCGYSSHEIEVVRWKALGRTNEEALQVINGQGAGGFDAPRMAL